MYRNYSIKSAKGVFYLTSKEPQEGYVETETSKGVYYHKEAKEVSGVLVGVSLKEPVFGGQQIALFLEDGDDVNVIQVNVLDQKNGVETWSKEIAKYLENLNLGDSLTFALNRVKTDKNDKLYRNMYVNREGEKVDWAIKREDVPPPTKTTHPRTKKETWDFTKQDDFYYEIIKREVDRLAYQKETTQVEGNSTHEDDDEPLPF